MYINYRNFLSEYLILLVSCAIRKFQKNQEGLELTNDLNSMK